jgi:hypothetical protein
MISIRRAPTSKGNFELREERARHGEGNVAWLARMKARRGILLIGGTSLSHFRIRVAQSHLRQDLYPSFWSVVAILHDDGRMLDTVSFAWGRSVSAVPKTNAVQTRPVAYYDDPERYPNVAWLCFPPGDGDIPQAVERVMADRSIVDLPRLVLAWLGFVWGAGQRGNPLLDGSGLPSASFVEAAYARIGIELTPGLASDASCAEAIWQSVKWWRGYYAEAAPDRAPSGHYVVRQKAAAVLPDDEPGPKDGPRRPSRRAASTTARRRGR